MSKILQDEGCLQTQTRQNVITFINLAVVYRQREHFIGLDCEMSIRMGCVDKKRQKREIFDCSRACQQSLSVYPYRWDGQKGEERTSRTHRDGPSRVSRKIVSGQEEWISGLYRWVDGYGWTSCIAELYRLGGQERQTVRSHGLRTDRPHAAEPNQSTADGPSPARPCPRPVHPLRPLTAMRKCQWKRNGNKSLRAC